MRRRSREKESFWRLALQEYRESGLSVREFCSREGLSSASLYSWKRKLRDRDVQGATTYGDQEELSAVEIVGSTSTSDAGQPAPHLVLTTPSGFTLRFPATIQPQQLSAVLGAIAQLSGAAPC